MLAVTIWYLISAKQTFKGPVRTIDDAASTRRARGDATVQRAAERLT